MSSSPCARMMHLAWMRDQGGRIRARVTCRSALHAWGGRPPAGRARGSSRARTLGPFSVRELDAEIMASVATFKAPFAGIMLAAGQHLRS